MFLQSNIDDDRVMGIEDLGVMHTWVDASYAVHPDMKGHTGGVMSYGLLGIFQQNLNTKSSTESKVVGVSDYMPQPIWAKLLFLGDQGHVLQENIVYQDNQSWFAPYKQIGIVFTLNNNNNSTRPCREALVVLVTY